jgi:phenylacetate-CoA ligase
VVVTALHNFAMPLLRYELGDYAVAGAPCRCGRGLPVLQRILGRVRNMLRLAGGERYWPMLGTRGFAHLAPVLQHQFVQTACDRLELRIVAARPLTSGEEAALREHVTRRLPAPMQVDIRCCADIPRSAGGKFEDFVCALD